MSVRAPRTLRTGVVLVRNGALELASSGRVTAAALLATGTASTANAQAAGEALPPVTVDAPRIRPKPVLAPKPAPVQVRARVAVRRAVRQRAPIAAPVQDAGPSAPSNLPLLAQAANANPYAQPGVPYKVNRVQSNKITEPLANTPRTITVLPKEALADKGATTLRELGRSTAGVTLGTGEGGNAFGDRFFIRGFDARNDIFLDGIRDPGVSVRENFFTEQVEILRGPGSTFAGRGVAGGAINIVPKTANLDRDFNVMESQLSPSDNTRRITVDMNKAISPILAVRVNGLFQNAGVAGRQFVTDNRWGGHGSVVFKPIEQFTLTANYTHTDLHGLPDFGVPYNRGINRPATENLVPRYTYYGLLNRDFQKVRQDFATITGEYRFNENITLQTKFRKEKAALDYIGSLPQGPNYRTLLLTLSPQSRFQTLGVFANQTDATIKWWTGPIKHTTVAGVEFSHEGVLRDSYSGLNSELAGAGAFSGNGALTTPILSPDNTVLFNRAPTLSNNPTNISVITRSTYAIHTANWNDLVLLNGGVRLDDYTINLNTPAALRANVFLGNGNPFTQFAYNHSAITNFNAGIVVKPIPTLSIYGAYATSANPVGAEIDSNNPVYGGLSSTATVFGPEKNKAVEVGVKLELFDRRLLLTGALFQTTKSNARDVINGTVQDKSAYKIEGIDLGIAGKITDDWSVIGGAVFMDTHITKSPIPTNVGLPLANLAHTSFSLLSKYQVTPFLELGGQAVYNSKRYGGNFLAANGAPTINSAGLAAPTPANPFLNVPTELPSYWRFDAFTEIKFSDNLKGKFAVYNLFNRTYYDAFYQTSQPFVQIAPGRVVQFTATASF